ncbi:hypothetical protein SAMD00019534_055210 [Acytostelium subglobosum LB1]|uniref:hypothetical protein n=1 Tax=Acytostelium subglobosum LB1 TaxID=1410327 RepID=UPI000644A69D|nr:hypothetical protein SAMD00019534_055210 [Acytostelium subglobosum LB1]GAM22346.1 hypothetical protein SAMD00019534_055210 [Acytostelium subglobosum LB1]|eukprot:XP_012754466.1 hypothetical protein SAMD00019534_055210 [Acytostelium subglobosum LB1]
MGLLVKKKKRIEDQLFTSPTVNVLSLYAIGNGMLNNGPSSPTSQQQQQQTRGVLSRQQSNFELLPSYNGSQLRDAVISKSSSLGSVGDLVHNSNNINNNNSNSNNRMIDHTIVQPQAQQQQQTQVQVHIQPPPNELAQQQTMFVKKAITIPTRRRVVEVDRPRSISNAGEVDLFFKMKQTENHYAHSITSAIAPFKYVDERTNDDDSKMDEFKVDLFFDGYSKWYKDMKKNVGTHLHQVQSKDSNGNNIGGDGRSGGDSWLRGTPLSRTNKSQAQEEGDKDFIKRHTTSKKKLTTSNNNNSTASTVMMLNGNHMVQHQSSDHGDGANPRRSEHRYSMSIADKTSRLVRRLSSIQSIRTQHSPSQPPSPTNNTNNVEEHDHPTIPDHPTSSSDQNNISNPSQDDHSIPSSRPGNGNGNGNGTNSAEQQTSTTTGGYSSLSSSSNQNHNLSPNSIRKLGGKIMSIFGSSSCGKHRKMVSIDLTSVSSAGGNGSLVSPPTSLASSNCISRTHSQSSILQYSPRQPDTERCSASNSPLNRSTTQITIQCKATPRSSYFDMPIPNTYTPGNTSPYSSPPIHSGYYNGNGGSSMPALNQAQIINHNRHHQSSPQMSLTKGGDLTANLLDAADVMCVDLEPHQKDAADSPHGVEHQNDDGANGNRDSNDGSSNHIDEDDDLSSTSLSSSYSSLSSHSSSPELTPPHKTNGFFKTIHVPQKKRLS